MKLSSIYSFIPQLFIGIIIVLISLIFVVVKQQKDLKTKVSIDDIENDYVPKKDFKQYCDQVTTKVADVVDEKFDNAESNISDMFIKQEEKLSEDKIEEVIENKLDSFMSEYKKTIKKFICKKIDEHNGNDSSSVNEEDVQNICMDMLESYTNDTINPVLEELATADDLNAVVKGIDALVNTCNTITLKVNEFDNEIYGDDEYYGLVDRIESVESTIDEANNSK